MNLAISEEWYETLKIIRWPIVVAVLSLHVGAVRGLCYLVTDAKWQTIFVCYLFSVLAGIGVLAGAHRYYSHRSYKANWKLRLILIILQTLSGQKSAIDWTLDHHTHHKYEGTNADAVSLGRGFFFAHIGWLMSVRHPECIAKRDKLNVDYLWNDPLVKLQHEHYVPLFVVFNVLIPTLIPYLVFGETLVISFFTCFAFRYAYTMQLALSGNSVAHLWGYQEYDKSSTSAHNKPLNYLTLGGGYHNFHHAFPYDYSASEFGIKSWNVYTAFIEFFEWIGWAYDLKKAPQDLVDRRRQRTGGEVDVSAVFKTHPIMDWILGLIISFNVVWTIIVFKLVIYFL